jgi:hypothetical protein
MELEPRTSAPAHATGAVEFVDLADISDDAAFRLREEGDVSALAASIGRLGQLVPVELRALPGGEGGRRRFQLVAGFRRVAALRLLRRERALARVHAELPDEDAWALALVQALLAEPLDRTAVAALQERLAAAGVAPWTADLLDEALVRAPVEAALRERFLEFLGSPEVAERSDDLGLDGEQPTGDEGDLAALDGDRGEAGAGAPAGTGSDEAEGAVEMTPEELASDLTLRLYEVNEDLAVAYEVWADLPPEGRRSIVEQARWIARLLPLLERGGEGER